MQRKTSSRTNTPYVYLSLGVNLPQHTCSMQYSICLMLHRQHSGKTMLKAYDCTHHMLYHPNVPRVPPAFRREGGGLAHNFTNALCDSSIPYDTINTVSHSSYCGHISQGNCDSQAHFLISNFKTHMKETYGLWGGKHPSMRAYKPGLCGITAG